MEEHDDRPWERPGAVRRDCEPPPGPLLGYLGMATLVCGLLSFCLAFPGLLSLFLGAITFVLAGRHLDRMRDGRMDPGGEEQVRRAERYAEWGMYLTVAAWLLGYLLALCMFFFYLVASTA